MTNTRPSWFPRLPAFLLAWALFGQCPPRASRRCRRSSFDPPSRSARRARARLARVSSPVARFAVDVDLATSTPSAPSVASSRAPPARTGDTSADAPESSPRGSNAESTISALDALLGVDADPEPDVAPPRVPDPESASRATVSSSPAETSVTRSRAESLGAVRGALTDEPAPSTPSRRSDPLDAYDPEFDPLGLGPRWDVPWSWPTLALTLVAVEASFYFAGALAPAIVYSSVREPDEMPLDDPAAFARDVQFVFDDPTSFADIVVCAEVVQTRSAGTRRRRRRLARAVTPRVVQILNHGRHTTRRTRRERV